MSELFPAVVKLAAEWLDLLVYDFMRADIATLGECLAANLTAVWALSCMSSFVCLQIAQLRKSLSTTGCLAFKGFCTSVRSDVNLQMSLLVEALGAIRHAALVPFPWFLTVLGLFISREMWLQWRSGLFCLDRLHESVDIGGEIDFVAFDRLRVGTLRLCHERGGIVKQRA